MSNKPEEISQENVGDTNSNIEYISQESIIQPDYSYGIDNETLDNDISIRNQPNIRRMAFLNS